MGPGVDAEFNNRWNQVAGAQPHLSLKHTKSLPRTRNHKRLRAKLIACTLNFEIEPTGSFPLAQLYPLGLCHLILLDKARRRNEKRPAKHPYQQARRTQDGKRKDVGTNLKHNLLFRPSRFGARSSTT